MKLQPLQCIQIMQFANGDLKEDNGPICLKLSGVAHRLTN